MPLTLTISAVAATSATIAVAGASGTAAKIQFQYANTDTFQWQIAPLPSFDVAANITLSGLNQASRYYARAREMTAAGIPGPWSPTLAFYTPLSAARVLTPAAIMIEPAIIVLPERIMSWTGFGDVAGYPARCMARDDPNSVWMCNTVGGVAAFHIEHSGAPIDTIAILESNAPENATITVKAANTAAALTSGPAYTSGPVAFRASANLPQRMGFHCLVRLAAVQSYRFWRVEINAAPPGNMFCATYAVLGKAILSAKNYSTDSKSETLIDRGSITRDRSGNPDRVEGQRGRTVAFDISQLLEADYERELEQIRWQVGITGPALVVPNRRAGAFLHDRILYGQLGATAVTNTVAPRVTYPFKIDSLI